MNTTSLINLLVFSTAGLVILYVVKLWLDWRTPFNDDTEIEEHGNLALALRRAGIYMAITLAMAGAFFIESGSLVENLKVFLLDAATSLILLLFVSQVNGRLMLCGLINTQEIGAGNKAVGLVEFGSYVATGLIFWASFTGEGGGVVSAVVFALLGQVALLAMFWAYEWLTPVDVCREVKSANPAAGMAVAGKLIALGIILAASIVGPFTSWSRDLASFGISAAVGIVLLLVLEKISDWLFLPHTTMHREIVKDRNLAAIALAQGVVVAMAILAASLL